jgi:hypothetical protein
MNNVYCVCTTPDIYENYVSNWSNFNETGKELKWLCDVTNNKDFKLDFDYTEEGIRNNLNFDKSISHYHFWNSGGRRNIIWFYPHFRMLNFYLKNPNYDYYWFFDDDVKCSDWVEFFKGFEQDNTDFLAYFIFKSKNVESQKNIPKIDDRTHSKEMWFSRFPGDGDILPKEINEFFGSFYPIVRYSNKAMEALLNIHNQGFYGYSEGYVPTILNYLGLSLSTIFNPESESNYFNNSISNVTHKGSKINWSWI